MAMNATSFIVVLNTSSTSMSTTIISLVVTIIFIFSILQLQRGTTRKACRNLAPLPPGPAAWPLLGNLPELLRYKPTFRWVHGFMREMNTEIACFRVRNTHFIPVLSPEIAREIYKKQDAIFASRPLTLWTQESTGGYKTVVLTPHGDQWRKMKKMWISEVVSPARLKWLHDKRAEEGDNLVFYVQNQYKANKIVDLRLVTRHYSTNVVRKMLFGRRYFGKGMPDGGPGPEEEEHVESVFITMKYVYSFCISDYFPFLARLDLDGQQKLVKHVNNDLIGKYHNPIIDERIHQWRSGQREDMDDILDVFINLKDPSGQPFLTEDEIRYQLAEITFASVDNPSNAVEWAMAEMINQPELMKKAQQEIDRVVGKERLVQESDIPELNYVKACAREAYRLHPLSPFNVPHMSMQDTTVAGYHIPKGSHVLVSRYGLGRNPKVWVNPLSFDPERHMNDGDVSLLENDLRFISFSTGRRGCIAGVLGTYMTIMLLARLVQCFDWTPPPQGIDLSEAANELLTPAIPVSAFAKPRLPPHLYPILSWKT
ncbi:hypothetical protein Tsubulata_040361 [Turnera subulata]|uniref:Uncharacterized protein n=1 Tax=Turnera subulata TaxID=218843 RepID=A0A9Q0JJA4_9ROSI|nr:hypothetical protein Tsubulata_040361 [Turnera subulata]